jgi:hypothetical protein
MRRELALLLACAAAASCSQGSDERARAEAEETRAIMSEIYGGLRVALLASVDLERFRGAESQPEIAAALDQLASHAQLLEKHASARDEQMRFLAGNVAHDARDVQEAYARGHPERAAFLLRQIVENCVVCHTRLPSLEDSALAKGFLDEQVLQELPSEPRVTLLMATRRFDEALAALEELLVSPSEPAALLLGPLTDYLVVSIRVKQDFARPLPTLAAFAKRPDLWKRLRRDVERWIEALPQLRERAQGEPQLATARALIDEGRAMLETPEDRSALAHLVVASSVLQRYIDAHREPDRDLAEAFYLLGMTEARIGRNYWVTAAPFLLEKAIRLAPREAFAAEAYALLERETFQAYEGSDWEDLPPDDAAHLAELRALIEGSG